VADGSTADGSTLTGLPAEDKVLAPAAASTALDALTGSDNIDTGTGTAVLGADPTLRRGATARPAGATPRIAASMAGTPLPLAGSAAPTRQRKACRCGVFRHHHRRHSDEADGGWQYRDHHHRAGAAGEYRCSGSAWRSRRATHRLATAAGWVVTGLVKRGALVSDMAFVDTPTVTSDYADTSGRDLGLRRDGRYHARRDVHHCDGRGGHHDPLGRAGVHHGMWLSPCICC
jgi:hypothetical protein